MPEAHKAGERVWWYREIEHPVQCRKCGGGGLLYDPDEGSRGKCDKCKGSGQVPGWRAWLEYKRIATYGQIDGETRAGIWDGEHLVYPLSEDISGNRGELQRRVAQRNQQERET